MAVQVLLSTYNGARYLESLIDSLLTQDFSDLEILVRDDGSSDGTIELLGDYERTCSRLRVLFGTHVGFIGSFFQLLEIASPTADYLALCDQDDVWLTDKISRAVAALNRCSREVPALYCSRLAVVDQNLRFLGYSPLPRRGLSFRNALVECQTPGCTIVLNQAGRRLLIPAPTACVSHDSWIYLVISAFGTIVYDETPRILYRKHATNAKGITLGRVETWKVKTREFVKTSGVKTVLRQAEEFRRLFGSSLSSEHSDVLDRFIESRRNPWSRIRYALSCDVYRQSRRDDYLLKAKIICDRL